MRGLRPTSLQRCAIAIRSSAAGRDDHEVRAGDVLELLTAGRARPGVGADREPVAVVDVLAGVLGDLLVVPDDLLDREQHGAVIHVLEDSFASRLPWAPAVHLDCVARSLGGRFPEPRPRDRLIARHPADVFEGARCCANCRPPPRRSQWKNSNSWTPPPRSRPGAASRCCTTGTTRRSPSPRARRAVVRSMPRARRWRRASTPRARPGASASRSCSASSACSPPTRRRS